MSADLTVRVALSLLSIACLYAVAIVGFSVGADAVRAVNVLLATALGLCAFMALGYLLAGLLPSQGAAQGIGNILVYPLIFLSGAAVPLSQLPEGVAAVARFSPLTQLTFLTKGLWEGQGWIQHWGSAASLIAMGVLCGVLAARCFRWER
jgi:putative membrane protein